MSTSKAAAVACLGIALLLAAGCAAKPAATTQANTSLQQTSSTAGASSATSSASASPSGAVPAEKPVPPETNPPGDIPDNQAFVPFKTAAGLTVKVPEGWSRQSGASSVSFTDKLNTIVVSWAPATSATTVASFESVDVLKLKSAEPAFAFTSASEARLPIGPAVHAIYQINSQPNAVTGKRYRLAVEQYSVFRNGTRVNVVLLSPLGADNVDPWRIVSQSLTWN